MTTKSKSKDAWPTNVAIVIHDDCPDKKNMEYSIFIFSLFFFYFTVVFGLIYFIFYLLSCLFHLFIYLPIYDVGLLIK